MNMQVQNYDAQQALGFVMQQRTHIESEVVKRPMPAIKYPRLIPVDTSAHAFAPSVTFFTQDAVGKAKFINTKGDDIPLVNIGLTKFEQSINDGGVGYGFSLSEIGSAQQMGMNLGSEGAMTAREAYEQLVEEVAFVGNAQLGVEGLYNTTGITSQAAAKTFATSTPQEILAEINGTLTGILTDTKGLDLADTIVLPMETYSYIATTQISPESSMTVLEFIQKSNVYTAQTGRPLTIEMDIRLSGKMVAYKRSPEALKMHMPMPLTFIPPQAFGLEIRTYGMFRFAPINIRRPKSMRYKTGI